MWLRIFSKRAHSSDRTFITSVIFMFGINMQYFSHNRIVNIFSRIFPRYDALWNCSLITCRLPKSVEQCFSSPCRRKSSAILRLQRGSQIFVRPLADNSGESAQADFFDYSDSRFCPAQFSGDIAFPIPCKTQKRQADQLNSRALQSRRGGWITSDITYIRCICMEHYAPALILLRNFIICIARQVT